MKKLLVGILLVLGLSANVNALTMSNDACYSSSGQVYVTVEASAWDVLYHENVIFSLRDSQYVWDYVTKSLNYGTHVYAVSTFQETELQDLQQYNIGTDQTTIIVGPCDD